MADNDYETKLTPIQEKQFQSWKSKFAPNDSGIDYDFRGAFKAGISADPKTGHWPDTYKKPNHPTFSVESVYAKERPELAGRWEGDKYVPPAKPSPTATPSPKLSMDDALSAALKMSFGNGKNGSSFFPAAQRFAGLEDEPIPDSPLQKQFGGGQRTPSPTPSPSAPKPSQMTLAQLYDHFGVPNPVASTNTSSSRPIYQNKPDQQIYDWRKDYGWA